MQLKDWLDDLCVRFVVNIPTEELSSVERICFQIEEAQWFYEDFIRPLDPSLPSLTLKPFFLQITQRCPLFREWSNDDTNAAFEQFLQYKNRVPVRGAILLNHDMDKVLLVRGFKKSATWSFPRGKINKDEDDLDCAVREAWEETGFDLKAAGLCSHPTKVRNIELTMRNQNIKLFVFRGVPEDAHFVPQTRKEIGKIDWYNISDLPTLKKKQSQHDHDGEQLVLNANKFYMVAPFVQPLKKIIAQKKKSRETRVQAAAAPVPTQPTASMHEQHKSVPSFDLSAPRTPSTLPEVALSSTADPLLGLKQQLHITQPAQVQHVPSIDHAKSNALLSLLRNGTPEDVQLQGQSQAAQPSISQPQAVGQGSSMVDSRNLHSLNHEPANLQAYPPAEPISNAPRLTEMQKSLLDVFSANTPAPKDEPSRATVNASKNDLLAAFLSPRQAPQQTSQPQANTADSLLRMLRQEPVIEAPSVKSEETFALKPEFPSMNVSNDHPTPAGKIVPTANPLLALLRRSSPVPDVPENNIAAKPELLQESTPAPAQIAKVAPVELATDTTPDVTSGKNSTKDLRTSLLSLLENPSTKPTSTDQELTKAGSTSATLNGPISEPHFDTISRPTIVERRHHKKPVADSKKLFDPHAGDKGIDIPSRVQAREEDRNRSQRSPRSVKDRVTSSPRRPLTPKEPVKVFQPQILKRPQSSGGEKLDVLELPKLEDLDMNSGSSGAPSKDSPVTSVSAPFRHALPKSTTKQSQVNTVTKNIPSQPPPPAPVDPQREALLSLLKAPEPRIEPQPTPRQPSLVSTSPMSQKPDPTLFSLTSVQTASPIIKSEQGPDRGSSPAPILGSITSSFGKPATEKRQTTASDKAFLMGYLQRFASQDVT